MKINKKLILMLILILIVGVLGGCKKKAPDGFEQEFYDDMIFSSQDLIKSVKNAKTTFIADSDILKSEGYDIIKKHMESTSILTLAEQNTLSALEDLYFKVAIHHDGVPLDEEIKELAKTLSNLLEIEVAIEKLLLK